MRHFIAYHNPKKMGYRYTAKSHHKFFTNKRVSHLLGNTVWIVSFAGAQHDYSLVGYFQVTDAGKATEPNFKHFVAGKGPTFRPWVGIKDQTWFPTLLRVAGNFGLGLSETRDSSVIEGLHKAAIKGGFPLQLT